jgi:hypothetical protein
MLRGAEEALTWKIVQKKIEMFWRNRIILKIDVFKILRCCMLKKKK